MKHAHAIVEPEAQRREVERRPDDELRPFRGVAIGVLLGGALWLIALRFVF